MNQLHHNKGSKKTQKRATFLLIGNPNVGKTTFFNHMTSSFAAVGNFDRTTVASNVGKIKKDKTRELKDLPGIYNLNSNGDDDRVVLNTIFDGDFEGIVNVTNVNSFLRDMYLTIQLLEANQPIVISLNMIDELKNKEINLNKLRMKLRTPVVLTAAKKDKGITEVKRQMSCPLNTFKMKYSPEIETKIQKISALLENTNRKLPKRFYAIQILEHNEYALEKLKTEEKNYDVILALIDETTDAASIYKTKTDFIKELYSQVFTEIVGEIDYLHRSHKIDQVFLRKWTALPIFFGVLAGVYFIAFGPYTGGYLNAKIDMLLNEMFLPFLINKMQATACPEFLIGFICNGILGGIFAVFPFIPYIIILFFIIGLLQQSGYLSRVSAVTDDLLSPFGITGRSVIGLISGMGCNVPTIMMARNSSSKKERYIATFIAPFISCSARATVFSFVANLVFPQMKWVAILSLQVFSGLVALLVGLVFSKTMWRNRTNMFFIELPRWRMPDFRTIFKMIWFELKTFLIRVGKFVLVGSIVVWLLSHIGPTGLLSDNEVGTSFLGYIGIGFGYLLWPLGLGDWRIAASLLLAFPAKELAVTNMIIVFGNVTAIHTYFNVARAVSFMVFFVLYIPCLSTMAVTKKETNWKMMFASIGVSLLVAYIFALPSYWLVYAIS